ncbi:unnamed protein product [Diamesa serratosioi]
MGETAAATSSGLPKPALRGFHNATIRRNLIVAGVLVVAAGVSVKFLINDPKKRDYAEFYKTYDANKSFQRMLNAGLLQCNKGN